VRIRATDRIDDDGWGFLIADPIDGGRG